MPETALETTENAKIETAVTVINDIIAAKVYDGAIQVGNYVLEMFFDNDPELASSKNPNKPVGYRNLCNHPDLAVSRTTLRNMVNVAIQETFLTANGIDPGELKYSYKVELLRLENGREKLKFARACIDLGMSLQDMKRAITTIKERRAGSITPTRQLENYVTRVNRWIKGAVSPEAIADPAVLQGLTPVQVERFIDQADMILGEMAAMQSVLTMFVGHLREKQGAAGQPGAEY